jgi:branched-chain amino acid transport system substrate-binding protein
MSKSLKISISVIVIILVIWTIAAHKKTDSSANPIKIGAVYGLTGIASSWTEVAKDAANMAADEINAAGGVNGRQIQMVYADSATDPAKSVSAFQKLTSVDHVDAAIGDVWAFLTNPLVPISTQTKTVLISPTVMDASVEKPGDYFFSLGHQMAGIEPAINKFFDQYPKAKTASLICWGVDPWGLSFTAEYEKIAAQRGVKIVMKTCTKDFTPDYRNEAAKAKAANADVILVDGLGDRAINTLRTFGVMSPIVADSNAIAGYEVGGTVSTEQLKNAYIIDWHASDDFVKKFEAKYGIYPILEAQNSYEAVRSIAKGLQNNPTDLVMGLKEVKYNSVDGANGVIDFTTGTNINPNKTPASLYTVHGKGQYEIVK